MSDSVPQGEPHDGEVSRAGRQPEVPAPVGSSQAPQQSLADGEWHRLHPATPLFRGGIFLIAVIGFIVVQWRDLLIELFIGGEIGVPRDPLVTWILGNIFLASVIVVAVLLGIIGITWLAWRFHTFRITHELIEEREGILRRVHRRGRLDRVQGVNVSRPFIPRLFGAARLDVSLAGNEGNIRLAYLTSATADALRADILRAAAAARREQAAAAAAAAGVDPASGVGPAGPAAVADDGADPAEAPLPEAAIADPTAAAAASSGSVAGIIASRVDEFLAPELDQELAEPDSIVQMHPGRLIASTALTLVPAAILITALVVTISIASREQIALLVLLPAMIAIGGVSVRTILRSLRYSIAATKDGIRVGFGFLSTTNETLPPGRVHAIQAIQPLLWRPFGWWSVRINRASSTTRDGAAGQAATTILPVGTLDDVRRVMELILPDVDLEPEFTVSPSRARIFRLLSRRRNGFALTEHAVVMRRGAIWRTVTIVPYARVQSVSLSDGPLYRASRLRRVHVHTVSGPVGTRIGALDVRDGTRLQAEVEERVLQAIAADA